MDFSTFYVSAEGFWLKHATCGDSLSTVRVLCLEVLIVVTFVVAFISLMHRQNLIVTVVIQGILAIRCVNGGGPRGWIVALVATSS